MQSLKTNRNALVAVFLFMSLAVAGRAAADEPVAQAEGHTYMPGTVHLEAQVPVLIPMSYPMKDVVDTGFGVRGGAGFVIWEKNDHSARARFMFSLGYFNHGFKGDGDDIEANFKQVPVLVGTNASWGSKLRFETSVLFGPNFIWGEACGFGECAQTETETELGYYLDMGVVVNPSQALSMGVFAGLFDGAFGRDDADSLTSFVLSLKVGYDL